MDVSYKGPMVLQNYFKKLKKGRKIGWFISKFTKRWFVLDMIRGDFYYTENHSKANPDKVYKLKEIGDLEENPGSVERCDWKFPFIVYAIDRKYVLHAETSSIRNEWCTAIRWIIQKNKMPSARSRKDEEKKLNSSLDLSYQEIEKEKTKEVSENKDEILVENQSKTYQIITTKIKNRPNIKTLKIANIIEKNNLPSDKKQNWIEAGNNEENLENKLIVENSVERVKDVKEIEDDEARLTNRESYDMTHNEIFSHPSTIIEDFQVGHINFSQIYEDSRQKKSLISTQRELYSDYKHESFTNTQCFKQKTYLEDLEQDISPKVSSPSHIIKAQHFEFEQTEPGSDYTSNQDQFNTTSFQRPRKILKISVDSICQLPTEEKNMSKNHATINFIAREINKESQTIPSTYIKTSAPTKEPKSSPELSDSNKEYILKLANIKSVNNGKSPNAIRRLRNTISRQKTENISFDFLTNSTHSPNRSILNNTVPNVSSTFDTSRDNIGEENSNSILEIQNSTPKTPQVSKNKKGNFPKKILKGKFIYKKSSQPSPTYKNILAMNSSFQNETDDTNSKEHTLSNQNQQYGRSFSDSRSGSPSILNSKLNTPTKEVTRSKKKLKTLLVEPSTAKVRDSIINELYQPIKPIAQVKPRLSSSFFSRQQSFNFETQRNERAEESYIY